MAENYTWLAIVNSERGFSGEALRYHVQAYELIQEWLKERPGDSAARNIMAHYSAPLIRSGAVEPYYTDAVKAYERACKSIARLVEADPSNETLCHHLEICYLELALCHEMAGQVARRVDVCMRYVRVLEDMMEREPGEGFGVLLGAAYGHLAIAQRQAGDAQSAKRAGEKGFEVFNGFRPKTAPHASPSNRRFRWANEAWVVAHELRRAGMPAKALALAQHAHELLIELQRESPGDSRFGVGRFRACEEIGKAHVTLGHGDEGLKAWLSGVEIMRRLVEQAPRNFPFRIYLANRCLNLSRHMRERGDFGAAAKWLLERENLLPADPLYARQLSEEFAALAAKVGRGRNDLSAAEQIERQRYLGLSTRPASELHCWKPPPRARLD